MKADVSFFGKSAIEIINNQNMEIQKQNRIIKKLQKRVGEEQKRKHQLDSCLNQLKQEKQEKKYNEF
ncbi:hypothetical protein [Enterococcus sp. LJL51]|uniref:hypothetical protein n=1 Tax=Enterococcus sp. LJL51 TaxID=3416656 RepID=UPI003CEE0A88